MAKINGTDKNDALVDTLGDDTIYAKDGNDSVRITNGVDYASGGTGEDKLIIRWGDTALHGEVYNTTSSHGFVGTSFDVSTRSVDFPLRSFQHLDVALGSGDDLIHATPNRWDIVDGGDGTDFWIDSFSSLATGMTFDVRRMASDGGLALDDGSIIRNIERVDLLLTGGDDVFRDFGAFDDEVSAGAGDDRVQVSDGIDYVSGGDGDDTLIVKWGDATEDAELHNTTSSHGFVGNSFASSSRSVDFPLRSFEHVDVRFGSGDDVFHGRFNRWDKVNGGAGIDKWTDSLSSLESGVNVLMNKIASARGQKFDDGSVARNVEVVDLTLTAHKDRFRDFGAHDDTVHTGAGDDRITLSGGDDYIHGGSGTDVLKLLWRDAGTDATLYNSGSTHAFVGASWGSSTRRVDFEEIEKLVAKLGRGDDTVILGTGNDTVRAGGGSDTVEAGGGNDKIFGEAGGDTLDGGNGDDTITGGGGHDEIQGGAGDDRLVGNGGNDRLDGGSGDDILTGGAKRDTFVYAEGSDVITDFRNNRDTIELDASDLGISGLTVDEVLDLAEVIGGDTVFDFGGGNVLTLSGFTRIAQLSDDLVLA